MLEQEGLFSTTSLSFNTTQEHDFVIGKDADFC